ncbi:MAG: RNA-directed DNA polymerase, partial [Patescibacteria group bacterium]
LIKVLREQFKILDEKLLNILGKQLKAWGENPTMGLGIPQGANASHVLGNAFLYPLDTFINDLKSTGDFEYFRYADDMVIMAKSDDRANQIIDQIISFLRQYHLTLNDKTKLEKLKDTKIIEEHKFYNDYGEINETSQQKIAKISKTLPRIFRKIKQGEDIAKRDISGLKYYLKAGEKLGSPEILDDLIAIIPKRPSLIYLICRYIGFFLSESGKFLYNLDEKLIQSKYEKIWKIYSKNSLTEWARFWLLKILSAPTFAKDHSEFQTELNRIITDTNAKFLRPLVFFYKAYIKEQLDPLADLGFSLDDIKRHIKNAKTETEKSIYYYFLIYLKETEDDKVIAELLYDALQSPSPEIQLMGIFLKEKLRFNLERDITGSLSRIYFKLPSPKTPIKTKDEFFTEGGRIAQDKLTPFFGIPTPLKVEIVAWPEKKENREHKFPHKLPAGTIWENFTIKFLTNEAVSIQVKQFQHNVSYKDMNWVGKGNNPRPSKVWAFLKVLAMVGGELTLKDPEAKDEYKKQKELLAKSLQGYFSLEYDPFYPYKHYSPSKKRRVNSYEIKITLIPPPQTENKKSDIREDKDDLGIKEYLDEQAPQVYEAE